ncbi:MAG: Trk system potassium transporter TrkA, partial [Planctomycetes bacterium]|nr:Trk system potassium transporter TrkA [Planctomycetota bacterium]
MKILIIGAGAVGFNIAETLSGEGHQVTVIESDHEPHRRLQERLNVLAILGNGASTEVLESAAVQSQDIFIAVTNSDEVNLISCLMASKYRVPTVIARLKSPEYSTRQAKIRKEELGIHRIINPDEVLARDIRNMVTRLPGAVDVAEFADGKVLFLGYRVEADTPVAGLTLRELGKKRGAHRFVATAVTRGASTIIPRGDSRLLPGDLVYFIVAARSLPAIQLLLAPRSRKDRTIFIHGGTRLGEALARKLEDHYRLKLLDGDRGRCDALEGHLKHTLVIHSDATDVDHLKEEGIESCDVFVAVTDNDELNILTALLAKHHGARRAITLANKPSYAAMVSALGIDHCVSARVAAANAIIRYVRRGEILSMARVVGNDSEVIEFQLGDGPAILGRPLRTLEFPRGAIIGAIFRRGEEEIAAGDSVLQAGDRVVVFA